MISIILPSFGRAQQLQEMFLSAINMSDKPEDIELCVFIEEPDKDTENTLVQLSKNFNVKWVVNPNGNRVIISQMTNEAAKLSSGDILMFAADDIRFETQGFDSIVNNIFFKFKDKILLCGGQDGYISEKQRFITHGFISRQWYDTVGWLIPPWFDGSYGDTTVNRLGDIINRKIILPIMIRHYHFAAGNSVIDYTMQLKFEKERKQNTGMLFYEMFPKIREEAIKLWEYILANK